MADLTITEAERKRLLHAFETLLFPWDKERRKYASKDEIALAQAAMEDILVILDIRALKTELHGGGEWIGDDLIYDGHWEALK